MQPVGYGMQALDLAPRCTLTHQDKAFLRQFGQTEEPQVSNFTIGKNKFRLFNFTNYDVSLTGGLRCHVKIGDRTAKYRNPGYDGSVYGLGSDLFEEYCISTYDPTYVVVVPSRDDRYWTKTLTLHYTKASLDGELRTQKFEYSDQYNCWLKPY